MIQLTLRRRAHSSLTMATARIKSAGVLAPGAMGVTVGPPWSSIMAAAASSSDRLGRSRQKASLPDSVNDARICWRKADSVMSPLLKCNTGSGVVASGGGRGATKVGVETEVGVLLTEVGVAVLPLPPQPMSRAAPSATTRSFLMCLSSRRGRYARRSAASNGACLCQRAPKVNARRVRNSLTANLTATPTAGALPSGLNAYRVKRQFLRQRERASAVMVVQSLTSTIGNAV
jgi:hypothetical protein